MATTLRLADFHHLPVDFSFAQEHLIRCGGARGAVARLRLAPQPPQESKHERAKTLTLYDISI